MSRSDDERIADIVEAADQILSSSRAVVTNVPRCRGADIIGLRTVLAHHYHRVDPSQVWTIASVEMPKVLIELNGPTPRGA